MDWYQTFSICVSILGAIVAVGGCLYWIMGRLSVEISGIHSDVKEACQRIDKQGERMDKLIYAFMNFQRDTDKLIAECQKDIGELKICMSKINGGK